MEKPNHVIFANTAEAFEDILNSAGGSEEGQKRIRHELALSQRAFFWEGDHKVVVTPSPIPKALFELNAKILSYENVTNYSPEEISLNLSKAVSNQTFSDFISNNDELSFSPYAITQSFIELIDYLKKQRLNIEVDNMPKKGGYELVKYLDSKSGFRKEIEKLTNQGVSIPEGYICSSIEELENKINHFVSNKRDFVIKADQGESGWGLIISRNNQISTKEIIVQVKSETIWSNGPYIVEEFVEPNVSIGDGSPSAEVNVTDSDIRTTYLCGQIVNNGEFQGTVIGKSVLTEEISIKISKSAMIIGKHFQSLGYRGIFDIDYVISKENGVFAVETNARRTGGTHVYDLARRLFGDDFQNHYLISNDHFEYSGSIKTIEEIFARTSGFLYSKNTNEGVIVTLINPKDNILGYVAIGADDNRSKKLSDGFKAALA